MIIYRTFVPAYSDDFGQWGWIPKNAPESFDPDASGLGVAHDALEHDRIHPNLTFEDELRAFGVIAWGRLQIQPGENRLSTKDLGVELGDLFISSGQFELGSIKSRRLHDDSIESQLLDIAQHFAEEVDTYGHDRLEGSSDDFKKSAVGWMRVGYRQIERRMSGCATPDSFCSAFEMIRSVKLPDAEAAEYDNTELRLKIQLADGWRVNVWHAYAKKGRAVGEDNWNW